MKEIRWGIIGTGRVARDYANALLEAEGHRLMAAASRRAESAKTFALAYADVIARETCQQLLEDPEIDAVYIATPHPQHAEWTVRALQAGKHVLCEKPLGINHPEVMAMVDAAAQSGRFLMEAFMYRCHPQTRQLLELVNDGAIGELRHIEASFGFHAPFDAQSRLFANDLAGGGILDVGCYPLSAARLLAGGEPISIAAQGHIGASGVDEWATALLEFEDGLSAQIATAVSVDLDNSLNLYGSAGRVRLTNPWLCSDRAGNWEFELTRAGREPERIAGRAPGLYVLEARHVASQIHEGALESPLMSWQDSQNNALALDAWRSAIGLEFQRERPKSHPGPLLGTTPRRRQDAPMSYGVIPGLEKSVSHLVMGCDNQPGMSHASIMWDQFFELGGNAFDTAHIYGDGQMETLVGHWHSRRQLRDELVIVGKGAHTPDNFPNRISPQLTESLDRLQTDYIDVYFLHRDNTDVPVAEFVDALNAEVKAGRVRTFGGSNWTLARIRAANDYAAARGLQGFSAVSNNFSLARMVAPIWPGVEAASTPEFRRYLVESGMALLPWSSQARGFFTPWAGAAIAEAAQENAVITRMQPTVAELQSTWFAPDNFERRNRAGELAEALGVEMINVALAFVLRQPFPCFPLIGPRTLAEIRSCTAALAVELTGDQLRWLNLGNL